MASEQFERLYARLLSMRTEDPPVAVVTMRAAMEASALPAPTDVRVDVVRIAGMPAEWIAAPDVRADRAVVYFHGGGFVMGSPDTHRKLASDLSKATDARVLLLDYPLAPEAAFPEAVNQLASATAEVLSEYGSGNVVLAGDSAGGGLVVSCLLELRNRMHSLPVAGVCLSPWSDLLQGDHAESANVAIDPIVRPQDTKQMSKWYLQDADPGHPLASPGRADLSGLPPLLIQVGASEVLVDDARRLAAKAQLDGVAVALEVWPEMVHVWQMFAGRVPEATQAVERIGEFVKASFESS